MPPLLETIVEDEDAEREKEEDVDEGECGENEATWFRNEAVQLKRQEGVE